MNGLTEPLWLEQLSLDHRRWIIYLTLLAIGALIGWLISRIASIRRIATLEAMLEMEMQSADERQQEMENRFTALSIDALKQNNAQFLDLARQSFSRLSGDADSALRLRQQAVENLVAPIKDALAKTERNISRFDQESRESQGRLNGQIENISRQHIRLEKETRKLTNALRRPEVRGQWGELSLRRLVELSGMVPHCDFSEQMLAESGKDRPDMVIHMPGKRQVVVDAKTPMDAYLSALESDSAEQRGEFLHAHALQVRKRIQALASKTYWAQFAQSADFVVLYIPGEQFLSAALERSPQLMELALEQKVILATPASLVALLRTIAHGWSQQKLNQHALEIRHAAGEYHQRLAVFSEHFAAIGKHIERTVDAYNRTVGSYQRKLMPMARQFADLGLRKEKDVMPISELVKPNTVDQSATHQSPAAKAPQSTSTTK